jgi:FmdE, Molybdenum formylmethanofuran dehydrogenase operon
MPMPTTAHEPTTEKWELAPWIEAAALPTFEVLDTRSAQGRLDQRVKSVTVADLVLAHGHACDGLLRGVWAMRALFDVAFPGAPIDRSDLLVVSKNSPCLGDVAAYLSGGRARFGTHRLDNALGVGFQLQRLSSGEAWEVREDPDFFPASIVAWEDALLRDELSDDDKAQLLAVHEAAQWDWVRDVLFASAPADHYRARELDHLDLPEPLFVARRSDTVNRSVPAPTGLASPDDPTLASQSVSDRETQRWRERYEAGPGI